MKVRSLSLLSVFTPERGLSFAFGSAFRTRSLRQYSTMVDSPISETLPSWVLYISGSKGSSSASSGLVLANRDTAVWWSSSIWNGSSVSANQAGFLGLLQALPHFQNMSITEFAISTTLKTLKETFADPPSSSSTSFYNYIFDLESIAPLDITLCTHSKSPMLKRAKKLSVDALATGKQSCATAVIPQLAPESSSSSTYKLFFDGGSRGNPGDSGAGAVIYDGNSEIWYGANFMGGGFTNNQAEYYGLIMGESSAFTIIMLL